MHDEVDFYHYFHSSKLVIVKIGCCWLSLTNWIGLVFAAAEKPKAVAVVEVIVVVINLIVAVVDQCLKLVEMVGWRKQVDSSLVRNSEDSFVDQSSVEERQKSVY